MSFATSKSDGSSFGSFEFSSRGPTVTSRDRDSTFTTSRGSTLLDASFKSVATTAKRSSLNSLTKDFTINKLRFKPGVLYGREKEQHVLQQSLERLTCHSKDRKKELVLISGVSGVGKTALANSITKGTSATVVSGKYDSQLRYEPYAGIVMAVGEVCGKILSLSDNPATESQFVAFRDQLVYNLNDELSALATVLPILEEITGKSFTSDAMDANVSGEQKNRFHYAFQKFIRVVGAYFCPLVLILDDLQRADKCSLDLLQILLTDQEGPGLMVIGCYRSDEVNQKQQLPTQRAPATGCYQTDEVDEGRLLANKVSTLMEISDKYGFNTTEIVLDNLGVREVNEVLSDVLSTYHNDVLGLAEICYRKTNGNIFFLTQILKLIHDNHLLEYHIGLAKWVWKEAEIETTIEATENVVDMMRESMNSLPSGISQFLQIAACLGFMFEERILSMVWHEYLSGEDDDTNKDVSLEEILVVVIDKGFLARKIDDDTKLLWVHDTILETAFSLLPQEKVESIQSRVGELLVSKIEDKDLGDTLFVVVNLLNKGGATKKSFDQIRLAELNLRAVKIALKSAAFSSAVKYVEKGVECLPQDRWTNYYSLSLDLYSTAAEVELMMAQFDLAELHCKEILAQQDSPIVDQIRAYVILYHLLYAGGKMQDALKLCVYVLKELRCTFPKTKIAKGIVSLAGLTRIKLAAKSRTSEEIENMPLMNDRVRTETMKILDYLTTASHFTKDPMLLLATLRSYQWTLQYGLCKTSPSTFGTIGLLMGGILFDFEAARCYGEYALQLMEKIGDTSINARVHMVVYAGVSLNVFR